MARVTNEQVECYREMCNSMLHKLGSSLQLKTTFAYDDYRIQDNHGRTISKRGTKRDMYNYYYMLSNVLSAMIGDEQ